MKTLDVRKLMNDPSAALCEAREQPVLVIDRDRPEALLVHLGEDAPLAEPGIRRALAVALYRDGNISFGQEARFSGIALAEFIRLVSGRGISVVRGTAGEVREDMEAIAAWRNDDSSSRMRAP